MRIIYILPLLACSILTSFTYVLAASPAPSSQMTQNPVETAIMASAPISLNEAIQASFDNNHGLRVAQEKYIAAQHSKRAAQAGYGPSINVETSLDRDIVSSSLNNRLGLGTEKSLETESVLTLNQMIWDGFATKSAVFTSDALLRGSKHSLADVTDILALSTINAILQVKLQKEIDLLNQKNIARYEEIIIQATDRANLGLDTIADISKAKSNLAQAQISLIATQASLQTAIDTLVRLTGLPANTEYLTISEPTIQYDSSEKVLSTALVTNPALANLQTNVDVATGQEGSAKSAFSPRVDLRLRADYSNEHESAKETYEQNLSAAGVLQWNVFNSGSDDANVNLSEANTRQNRETLRNSIDQMKLDIEIVMSSLAAAQEQFKYETSAIEYNTNTLAMYIDQFFSGSRTLLDLLNAEGELHDSKVLAATNETTTLTLQYRLLLLSGELLASLGIPTDNIFAVSATLQE